MPPRDLPLGSDTLSVPCYLSTGPDDPRLAAWKSEHPEWFEAGTWTRAPQLQNPPGERPAQDASLLGAWDGSVAPYGMLAARPNRRPPTASSGIGTGTTRPMGREPGREPSSADWPDDALRAATFRIGSPSVEWPDGVGTTSEKVAANKPQSLPFVDDQGQPVITPAGRLQGQPMQFPADFDPHFFVARGLAVQRRREELGQASDDGGGYLAALALDLPELRHFGQGRSWDAQRFQGKVQDEWIDYATVGIGLYAAAAGMSREEILRIEDLYASRNSDFVNHTTGEKTKMDETYSHLRHQNVLNTELGFDLYESGRLRSPTQNSIAPHRPDQPVGPSE